jgi:hydrogenase expression/formation protein HypE
VTSALVQAGIDVHCLRDLTRGGLATALHEIAEQAAVGIEIDEAAVPIDEPVAGACELLGLDPLYVANEGRMVAFVAADDAQRALESWRRVRPGARAAIVGRVVESLRPVVVLHSTLGTTRVLDLLSGEQLPRIC